MTCWERIRLPLRLQGSLLIGGLLASVATPSFAFFLKEPDIELGRTTYQEACASCHGANLEGQPNWQAANSNGTYPAPPHDETGHTWHHGDEMLLNYIRKGGQVVLGEMGVDFMSGMPAFGEQLSDAEIEVILAYIKSTWPARVRATQEDRTRLEAASE
jgi:mono/diheme cytochrome c family protein